MFRFKKLDKYQYKYISITKKMKFTYDLEDKITMIYIMGIFEFIVQLSVLFLIFYILGTGQFLNSGIGFFIIGPSIFMLLNPIAVFNFMRKNRTYNTQYILDSNMFLEQGFIKIITSTISLVISLTDRNKSHFNPLVHMAVFIYFSSSFITTIISKLYLMKEKEVKNRIQETTEIINNIPFVVVNMNGQPLPDTLYIEDSV